jgi:hypothetical protein
MAHKTDLVNDHIIAKVTTDDGAIVDPYGHPQVVEFVKKGL